eukprot:COSAG02_NODE_679_length_18565_cov_57.795245_7_plen_100_part_00
MQKPYGSGDGAICLRDDIASALRLLPSIPYPMFGRVNLSLCRESWNEPDGQCGRDLTVGIKCSIPAFLAYYDACSAGLSEADPHLLFVSVYKLSFNWTQ